MTYCITVALHSLFAFRLPPRRSLQIAGFSISSSIKAVKQQSKGAHANKMRHQADCRAQKRRRPCVGLEYTNIYANCGHLLYCCAHAVAVRAGHGVCLTAGECARKRTGRRRTRNVQDVK